MKVPRPPDITGQAEDERQAGRAGWSLAAVGIFHARCGAMRVSRVAGKGRPQIVGESGRRFGRMASPTAAAGTGDGLFRRIYVGMPPIVESPKKPGKEAHSDEYFRNVRSPHRHSPNSDYRPLWGKTESFRSSGNRAGWQPAADCQSAPQKGRRRKSSRAAKSARGDRRHP